MLSTKPNCIPYSVCRKISKRHLRAALSLKNEPYFFLLEISSYLDDFDGDYYYGYYFTRGEPRFSYDDFDDSNANTRDESWINHVYNLSTGERVIVTANMCDQTLTTPRTNRVQNNDILEIRSRE